jgi:hypothetical protein
MPARRQPDTRSTTPAEAKAYLTKAKEFLEAAVSSRELGNNAAAVGNAVHAGIAAADAIAGARGGSVWRGEHGRAPAHLETAGGAEGRQAARQLRRLLPLKNRAEYDPAPLSTRQAAAAVQAAERLFTIASQVVAAATPD